MTDQALKRFFGQPICERTGDKTHINNIKFLSGGWISHAAFLETREGSYFIKWGSHLDLFGTEKAGLDLLRGKSQLKIPYVFGAGSIHGKNFILMEYIASGPSASSYWINLGQGLAELHKHTAEKHGLSFDNYIGRLPQKNKLLTSSWFDFFIEHRLEFQLKLAMEKQLVSDDFVRRYRAIYQRIPDLIPDEQPSLLHGDLWSGNIIPAAGGEACVIDPAVYFGSREIELAFTKLFGGFDRQFYLAYEEAFPLAPGFEDRVDIYNIYPLMVHANMFGSSYLSAVERTIGRL